jgi:hypothetical protein
MVKQIQEIQRLAADIAQRIEKYRTGSTKVDKK